MTNTTITNFRKNVFSYVNQAIQYNDPVNIVTKAGNAVLISEEDWNSIQETIYLHSVPGLSKRILSAQQAPDDEFVSMEDMAWED